MPIQLTQSSRAMCGAVLAVASLIAEGFIATPLQAQYGPPPLWIVQSIDSKILGEARRLRISLPVGYEARENADEHYGVLIELDAQFDVGFAG